MYAMTAAHPTLPLPSYARISNPPTAARWWCASTTAARSTPAASSTSAMRRRSSLDLLRGVAPVELERLTFDEIRAGAWRRGDAEATRLASATAPRGAPAAPRPLRRCRCPRRPSFRWRRRRPSQPRSPAAPPSRPWRRSPRPLPALAATPARGFWVQLGAFRESAGAESFQRRVGDEVEWLVPLLATFGDATLYRVQAGPYRAAPKPRGRRRGCARRSGWCR